MIPIVKMEMNTDKNDSQAVLWDYENLNEEDFQERYKATKRQFKAILNALKALHEAGDALAEEGPMEMNYEIVDATRYLIDDYENLLEQMSMAAYWQKEGI